MAERTRSPSSGSPKLADNSAQAQSPNVFVGDDQESRAPSEPSVVEHVPPRRRGAFEVVIRPVELAGDYISRYEDYVVHSILEEFSSGSKMPYNTGETWYRAKLESNIHVYLPYSRLIRRDNGQAELDRWNRDGSRPSQDSVSSDADLSGEVRPLHQRRTRPQRDRASRDSEHSAIVLSSDDQSVDQRTRRSRRIRTSARRKIQESLGPNRRSSASTSGSEDHSNLPGTSRRQQKLRSSARLRNLPVRSRGVAINDEHSQQSDYGDNFSQRFQEEYSDGVISSEDQSSGGDMRSKKRKRRQASIRPFTRKRRVHDRQARRHSSPELSGQGTRRSGRAGRPTKSMKERGEEDIWAADDVNAAQMAPRAVGAREIFKAIPMNDFRLMHSKSCDTCGQWGDSDAKGSLVFCQGCVAAYHKSCLGYRTTREHLVTKIAHDNFVLQCRRCVNAHRKKEPTAPRLDVCQDCGETGPACAAFRARRTAKQEEQDREQNDGEDPIVEVDAGLIDNVQNILFRCCHCKRAYHFDHLPARDSDVEMDEADMSISELRHVQYARDMTCLDCLRAPGKLQGLVAWRPTDLETCVPGSTVDMVDEDDKEYLVKWANKSYLQATWVPGAWVWGVTVAAMRKAFAKRDDGNNLPKMTTDEAIPEEFIRVDIVLDVAHSSEVDQHSEEIDKARVHDVDVALVKYKGLGYDEVVWEDAPKPEDGERWEDFVSAYEDWVRGEYIHLPNKQVLKEHLQRIKAMSFQKKILKKTQPEGLTGGKLMEYQLDGLNWLLYQWHKGQNAILADEMGLGKTIQVIGLLSTLVQDHGCWPFLVVVPNSTCLNWRREIKRWAPDLRAVTYYGSAEARNIAMEYELRWKGKRDLRCHIVITSYEAAVDEESRRFFKWVPWSGLVVDEGQRLKNDKNLLYDALHGLKIPFRVLLTGTPLQNNTRELFNLLQFLDSDLDAAQLEEDYAVLDAQAVARLHDLIRPFFLRRTKAQVLTFLPPMAQIIVPVSMTVLQKKLYKSILAKNPELIKSIFRRDNHKMKSAERSNLNNILMQLRKCLCHPFVYSKLIEERDVTTSDSHRTLVEASPKLQLLAIMLPALKARGHRALIFSQFLDMLDLVEDFLEGLGLSYQRLDGNTSSLQKQKRIDAFNAPDSPLFAFLLSTRAGGVGINLATADTVIIMDPDFSPHQDIQALSRAHRIGQQKKVLIFQLMTRDSAEEKIIQIGRKKMALDHILIDKMDADDDSELDLQSILQHGAAALFHDDAEREIRYDVASVEKLLDRTQAESTKADNEKSAESQFSYARVWAHDQGDLQDDLKDSEEEQPPDPSIWDKLLVERERDAAKRRAEQQETFGRGKRKRQVVNYAKEALDEGNPLTSSPMRPANDSGNDTDFREGPADGEDDDMTEDEGQDMDPIMPEELAPAQGSRVQGIADPYRDWDGGMPGPQMPGSLSNYSRQVMSTHINTRNDGLLQRYPWPTPAPVPAFSGNTIRSLTASDNNILNNNPTTTTNDNNNSGVMRICPACNQTHSIGHCPLKLGGFERCPLCGLAHYGAGPTCPHLHSEEQVTTIMDAIKQSPEDRAIKDAAMSYLRGVKGKLAVKRRKEEERQRRVSGGTGGAGGGGAAAPKATAGAGAGVGLGAGVGSSAGGSHLGSGGVTGSANARARASTGVNSAMGYNASSSVNSGRGYNAPSTAHTTVNSARNSLNGTGVKRGRQRLALPVGPSPTTSANPTTGPSPVTTAAANTTTVRHRGSGAGGAMVGSSRSNPAGSSPTTSANTTTDPSSATIASANTASVRHRGSGAGGAVVGNSKSNAAGTTPGHSSHNKTGNPKGNGNGNGSAGDSSVWEGGREYYVID